MQTASPSAATTVTSAGVASSTTAGGSPSTVRRFGERSFERGVQRVGGVGQADVGLGPAVAVATVVIEHSSTQRGIGGLLVGLANRRPDGEALGVGVLAPGLEHHLPRHLGDELRVRRRRAPQPLADGQWRGLCFLELLVGEEPEVMHPSQDIELPRLRPLRVGDGVVRRRRLGQAGEHRRLGRVQVLERLGEIDLRRGREAVRPLPEEDLVDVQLEDLVLGQVGLDLPGQQHLAQLAGDGLFPGQEEVPGDLHRDRPGALLGAAGQVGDRRPEHRQIVDAAMLVEALVLGGQNGLFHDIRDFGDRDDRPALLAEFAQELPFGRNHPQRDFRLVFGQRLERRQRRIEQRQDEGPEQGAHGRQAQQDRADVEQPAF